MIDRNGDELAAVPSGYGPADLRSALQGQRQRQQRGSTLIAIVDAYHYANAEADLAVYRAQFRLPPCTKANGCFRQVDQNGGTKYPTTNLGWNQEVYLDYDMASAMCPEAAASCSSKLARRPASANLAKAV
ncbi:MAG: hypothetical protein U1F50_04300 [Rubrivivax sp.]